MRVVIRGVPIPPVVEHAILVLFVVMQREVPILEPHDLQASALHTPRIESEVVVAYDAIRRELWLGFDTSESVVRSESLFYDAQTVEIDRCTVAVVRRTRVISFAVYATVR